MGKIVGGMIMSIDLFTLALARKYTDNLFNNLKNKKYTDIFVLRSAFVSDTTYTDYPYKATLEIDEITSDNVVSITFSLNDATSGNFAPICESDEGCVYIYAKVIPKSDITIPLIEVIKV